MPYPISGLLRREDTQWLTPGRQIIDEVEISIREVQSEGRFAGLHSEATKEELELYSVNN